MREPGEGRHLSALRALVGIVALAGVLLPAGPADATSGLLTGRVASMRPEALHEIWVTTSLDLSDPAQPALVIPVDLATGAFEAPWDPAGRRYWIFLHERFQPVGGPPLDQFIPLDLLPLDGVLPAGPVTLRAADPDLLMNRARLSMAPGVLARLAFVVLLFIGGGLGLRRALAPRRAPPGPLCAPLADLPSAPAPTRRELAAVGGLLGLALALRLPGFLTESFDLLEVSYLPGTGRPSPFTEGARGFAALGDLLGDLAALHCLDLVHPPLYHALMGVMGLFGRGEWLMRLPALLASLATVVVVWALFRRWSPAGALLGALAFAASGPAIYWGQDATPYALVALLIVLAILSLLTALREGQRRAWSTFFCCVVGAALCHYGAALAGLGALVGLGIVAARQRRDPRWAAAIHLATGPALVWAVPPVAWSWLHFSSFPSVAQDTRLYADAFMPDPGLFPFTRDFVHVLGGGPVDAPLALAGGILALLALGLQRTLRPQEGEPAPAVGALLLGITLTFALATLFFHENLRISLAGRIFYGFRWVSWFQPLLLGLCALGAVAGRLHPSLRLLLAALWCWGIAQGTATQLRGPARPDYRAAASMIVSELQDRDAVATLPTWFQRTNLVHYLMEVAPIRRAHHEAEGVFALGALRIAVEAIHETLPFETTVLNPAFDRLWLVVVDERSFGRPKWNPEVARNGVAWADEHLVPDGAWDLGRIRLLRYLRPEGSPALPPGEELVLSSAEVVLGDRTYPRLPQPVLFVAPDAIPPGPSRQGDLGRTSRYQAPMTTSCRSTLRSSPPGAGRRDSELRWHLEAAIPVGRGDELPVVEARGPARIEQRRDGTVLRVWAVGSACDGPPVELSIQPR